MATIKAAAETPPPPLPSSRPDRPTGTNSSSSRRSSPSSYSWFNNLAEGFIESLTMCLHGDPSSFVDTFCADGAGACDGTINSSDNNRGVKTTEPPIKKSSSSLQGEISSLPSFLAIPEHNKQGEWDGLELETSTIGYESSLCNEDDDTATDGTTTDIGKVILDNKEHEQKNKKKSSPSSRLPVCSTPTKPKNKSPSSNNNIPVLSHLPSFSTQATTDSSSMRSHRSEDIYSYPSDSFLADYSNASSSAEKVKAAMDISLSPISQVLSDVYEDTEGEESKSSSHHHNHRHDFVDVNTLLMIPETIPKSNKNKTKSSQQQQQHPSPRFRNFLSQ